MRLKIISKITKICDIRVKEGERRLLFCGVGLLFLKNTRMFRSLSRILRIGEETEPTSDSKKHSDAEEEHEFELPCPVPEIFTLTEQEDQRFREKLASNAKAAEGKEKTVEQEEHAFRKVIEEELAYAAQDHKDDKIFLASSRIQKLRQFIRTYKSEKSTDAKSCSPLAILQKMMDSNPIFKEIIAESERARKFLRKLELVVIGVWHSIPSALVACRQMLDILRLIGGGVGSFTPWQEDLFVLERGEGQRDVLRMRVFRIIYSFKVMGVVGNPMLNLIPLLLETDLYPNWFPMMASAEEVFSGSRFHKILSTSEMSDGKGYDVMEHNRVVISSHSISEHPKVNIGKCPEDRVRVDISVGGFKLIPVGNKRTHVTVMFNLNPHIPYLPSRIANFFLRHVVNQIHSSMEKHSTFKKGIASIRFVDTTRKREERMSEGT
eukprot:jgi/Bigna1/136875/aug1.36_g11583